MKISVKVSMTHRAVLLLAVLGWRCDSISFFDNIRNLLQDETVPDFEKLDGIEGQLLSALSRGGDEMQLGSLGYSMNASNESKGVTKKNVTVTLSGFVETMLSDINASHKEALKQLEEIMAAFDECNQPVESLSDKKKIHEGKIRTLKEKQETCKEDQTNLDDAAKDCKLNLEHKKKMKDNLCKKDKVPDPKICDKPISTKKQYYESMHSIFEDLLEKLDEAEAKCKNATEKHDEKKDDCDVKDNETRQHEKDCDAIPDIIEADACAHDAKRAATCTNYSLCWETAQKNYDRQVPVILSQVKVRKGEWRGSKRIGCLVKTFHTENQTHAIEHCIAIRHDTSHLDIVPEQPPEELPCDPVDPDSVCPQTILKKKMKEFKLESKQLTESLDKKRSCTPVTKQISGRQHHIGYQNEMDGALNVYASGNEVIDSWYSYHDNGAEDRQWKIKTEKINSVGVTVTRDRVQVGQTGWYQEFTLECPAKHVMTGVWSHHGNHEEDREWAIYCNYVDGITDDWVVRETGGLNDWDGELTWTPGTDNFVVGFRSIRNDGAKDRIYYGRYVQICQQTTEQQRADQTRLVTLTAKMAKEAKVLLPQSSSPSCIYVTKSIMKDPHKDYDKIGSWDGHDYFYPDHNKGFLSALWTEHNNHYEDRVWMAVFSDMVDEVPGLQEVARIEWSNIFVLPNDRRNIWTHHHSNWEYTCPSNYVMGGFEAGHSNNAEDRAFHFKCVKVVGNSAYEVGEWGDWINGWDGAGKYNPKSNEFLWGVSSQWNGGAKDRIFRFRSIKFCQKQPSLTPTQEAMVKALEKAVEQG